MFKSSPLIVLATITMTAQLKAAEPELRFEAAVVTAVVKPALSVNPYESHYLGCYVGPGMLQYNCTGTVAGLVAEALNLENYQFKGPAFTVGTGYTFTANDPVYAITAKLSKPATRQQMDEMLGRFLQETMEVRYHFEKRPFRPSSSMSCPRNF
jgi:uncharacterized protein (TIGR03435 family)